MKLVILIGDAAVGKMTVGQELMKQTGLRLFHNHMYSPVPRLVIIKKHRIYIGRRLKFSVRVRKKR